MFHVFFSMVFLWFSYKRLAIFQQFFPTSRIFRGDSDRALPLRWRELAEADLWFFCFFVAKWMWKNWDVWWFYIQSLIFHVKWEVLVFKNGLLWNPLCWKVVWLLSAHAQNPCVFLLWRNLERVLIVSISGHMLILDTFFCRHSLGWTCEFSVSFKRAVWKGPKLMS